MFTKGNGELFSLSPKSSWGKTFLRIPIHFRMMRFRNPLQSQYCPQRVFLTTVSSVYQAIFWTYPTSYSNYHFTDCKTHSASFFGQIRNPADIGWPFFFSMKSTINVLNLTFLNFLFIRKRIQNTPQGCHQLVVPTQKLLEWLNPSS